MCKPSPVEDVYYQKKYLKITCKALYFLGLGEYWYEISPRSEFTNILYSIWVIFFNILNFLFMLNMWCAIFRSDLTLQEQNDYIQFIIFYASVFAKHLFIVLKRDRIQLILQNLVENHRTLFSSFNLDESCVVKIKRCCVPLFIGLYFNFVANTLDGIRTYLIAGVPIRTVVFLYPAPQDSGIFTNIIRFLIEVHAWYIISLMFWIDCLSFIILIILQFKFKLVRLYFNSLRRSCPKQDKKDKKIFGEEYKKQFIFGIQLHMDAIWCSQNTQLTLRNVISAQVMQSVALFATFLIELATGDRSVTLWLSNLTVAACVLLLTASYMMTAGDITYEASLVSASMFHSGWDLNRASAGLRKLVSVSLQGSQVPIDMTAFGMMTLSYANFIFILRTSYSCFAVLYTK